MDRIAVCALLASASAFFLVGCSEPKRLDAESVLTALRAGGVELTDVQRPVRDPSSPMPNSYTERVSFALPVVAPKGGQVLVCDRPENCDAIYAYFQALKMFAGPYVYRSKSGVVVAQLNSGLEPSVADKARAVIESLP